MMKIKTYLKRFLLTLAFPVIACAAASCLRDNGLDCPRGVAGSGESEVTFSVRIPSIANPASRALSATDESAVETIDVFVFDAAGLLRDRGYGLRIEDVSAGGEVIKTFTTRLLQGEHRDVMFLLNSREWVDAAYPSGVQIGVTTKSDFTAAVETTLPSSGWNATSGTTDYRHIPMWGIKKDITIDASTSLRGSNAVKVSRMVARVNVSLDNAITTGNFKLSSVRLYNYNTKARVIPADANGNWTAATPYATAPTVPTQTITEGPLAFTTMTTPDKELRGAIYMFEAVKGVPFGSATGDFMENPCLVVGGKYDGSDKETFYRIDFTQRNGNGTVSYLDILRNHSYNVVVKTVSGPGKDQPDDAFNSIPENIETVVTQWNDQDMTEIIFDGVNMLSVSQGAFSFSREARTTADDDNFLTVVTDVLQVGSTPGGWTARIYNDYAGTSLLTDGDTVNGWLRLSTYSGTGNYPTGNELRLLLDENQGTTPRTAYIHVSAGRLTYIVTVVHTPVPNINLEVVDGNNRPVTEMVFSLISPVSQNFRLKWAPASSTVRTTVTPAATAGSQPFSVASPEITPALMSYISGNGDQTYTVNPGDAGYVAPEDLFYEKSARVEFELATEVGTLTKTLLLRQMEFNLLPVPDDFYLMDDQIEHKLLVRSNFPWKVEIAPGGDPKEVVEQFGVQYGGGSGYKEDYIRFKLKDNLRNFDINKMEANVKIVFYQLIDGVWTPWKNHGSTQHEYSLYCLAAIPVGEGSCYMMKPAGIPGGGIPIRIPFSVTVNSQVTDLLGTNPSDLLLDTNEYCSVELVWTDNPNRIADDSSIKRLIQVGHGNKGYLIVVQGSSQGNAVVAVRNSMGKIAWSWHIWVTDYDPNAITAGTANGAYTGTGSTGKVYRYRNSLFDYVWMDRNIGAGMAEPSSPLSPDIYGMYYQWGRKDPFPGPAAMTGNAQKQIYDASGALGGWNSVDGIRHSNENGTALNLQRTIENPKTFYFRSTNADDWYSSTSLHNNNLWNLATPVNGSRKTVFDPCPEGWRVPTGNPSNTSIANSPWGGTGTPQGFGNGFRLNNTNDVLGYWACGGQMLTSGSAFVGTLTGNYGWWWTATPNGNNANRFYTYDDSLQDVGPLSRSFGFNVRCVKDY